MKVAADPLPFQKWTLRFEDHHVDSAYLESQVSSLRIAALYGHMIVNLFIVADVLTNIFLLFDVETIWHTPSILVSACVKLFTFTWVVVSSFVLIFWRRAQKDFPTVEVVVVTTAVMVTVTASFSNYYRVAGFFKKSPIDVWQRDVSSDAPLLMIVSTVITAVHCFVPIRNCVSWLIPFCGISAFISATALGGTPEDRPWAICLSLIVISFCSWYGARRNEAFSRKIWGMLHQSQDRVQQQEKELSLLENRIQGMTALMNVQCQSVFPASSQLQVVGNNARLDELLGPMQDRMLEEALSDVGSNRDRYKLVVSPFLNARNNEDNARVVLVPPVTFQAVSNTFDAEIIVADTGSWNSSGADRWRYLVGLKIIEHANEYSSMPSDLDLDSSTHSVPTLSRHSTATKHSGNTFPAWAQWMPSEDRQTLLRGVMSRLPCDAQKCCKWHSAMSQLLECLRDLDNEHLGSCKNMWFPSFAWQCKACFSLHDDQDNADWSSDGMVQCEVCGELFEGPRGALTTILDESASPSENTSLDASIKKSSLSL